jgi:hypothetical protein
LDRSLDAGFSDPQQLDADPAFDSVRDIEPFQKLRQRLPASSEPADR